MITITDLLLIHSEKCRRNLKEAQDDIIAYFNTPCVTDCQWVDVQAEIYPCGHFWRHRWCVEYSARPSNFNSDEPESGWTSYHEQDFTTWTLRRAWRKADKVMWTDLHDFLHESPSHLPTRW